MCWDHRSSCWRLASFRRCSANDYQNYETGHSVAHRSQYVGEIRSAVDGWVEVETKNRFAVGDTLEVIHPSGNQKVKLTEMRNSEGQPVEVAQGNPIKVWIPLEARYQGALLARVFETETA